MKAAALRGLRGLVRRCRRAVVVVRTAPAGSWWILDGELLYRVNGRCQDIADQLTRDPYFYPDRRP